VRRAGKDPDDPHVGRDDLRADEAATNLAKGRRVGGGHRPALDSLRRGGHSGVGGKTKRVIILHEAPLTGGAGAEFAARIAEKAFDYLDAPIKRHRIDRYADAVLPAARGLRAAEQAKVLAAARELLAY